MQTKNLRVSYTAVLAIMHPTSPRIRNEQAYAKVEYVLIASFLKFSWNLWPQWYNILISHISKLIIRFVLSGNQQNIECIVKQ